MKYEIPKMEVLFFDTEVTTNDIIVNSGAADVNNNNVNFIDPWAM